MGRVVRTIANYQDGVYQAGVDTITQDVITQTVYDRAGHRVATIDPQGLKTRFVSTLRGQLHAVEDNSRQGLCNVMDCNLGTIYAYDRSGNRTSMTDANGHTRTWSYDAMGRMASATDALGVTTNYTYDPAGRLVLTDDPRGSAYDVTQTYDELSRPTTTSASPTGLATPIARTYDLGSRPKTLVDATGTTTYSYDVLSRVTSVAAPNGTVGYGYDALGRRTQVTASGQTVLSSYLANGLLDIVTQNSQTLVDYTYSAQNGQLQQAQTPTAQTTYAYNALGDLTALVTTGTGGANAQFGYTLNHAGQVEAVTETVNSVNTTWTYAYDGVNRLTQATSTQDGTWQYSYDLAGNRGLVQNPSGGTESLSYNAANQVTTHTVGGVSQNYTYDAVGNLASDGTRTLSWDALNRLTQVQAAQSSSYTYDGNGVLQRSLENNATTTYIQDTQAGLSQVLARTTAGVTTKYRYGLERLGSVRGSTTTWEYHDRQGSVRLELTGTGGLNQALRYDAWGQVLSGAPAPFGYTGELRSATTGLEYLRARWYNPATGTLLGRDPFAGNPEQPYSLHPYQYAYSQPTRFSDPSGQCIPYVEANCLPVWELGQGPNWKDGGQAIWESIQAIGSPGMLVSDFFTGRNDFGEFWSDLTPSKVAGGVFLGVTLCGGAIRALAARFPTLFSGGGVGAADRAASALNRATQADEFFLFRGTTEGYAGGEALQRLGVTPTSTDPGISTIFAINANTVYGKGVLYIATSTDLSGIDVEVANVLEIKELETVLDILPTDFANRASLSLGAEQARQILSGMGISIPPQIAQNQMDFLIESTPRLTPDQIQTFVEKALALAR